MFVSDDLVSAEKARKDAHHEQLTRKLDQLFRKKRQALGRLPGAEQLDKLKEEKAAEKERIPDAYDGYDYLKDMRGKIETAIVENAT